MSAAHASLARHLLPLAAAALSATREEERSPLLAALDAFLAAPSPSRFLAAWRTLSAAQDRGASARLRLAADERALPFARDRVARSGVLSRHAAEALQGIPADGATAARLRALVLLVEARAELAGRVEAAVAERRVYLEKVRSSRPPSRP